MFLSDTKIEEFIKNDEIIVSPSIDTKNIRSLGIRIHLGQKLIQYKNDQSVDPTKDTELCFEEIDLSQGNFVLEPGAFVLGATLEAFKTPRNIAGFLDGRSTLARLGLSIHSTAAIIDGLYEEARTITLEIYNAGNLKIILSHKMAIGSLAFFQLDQEVVQAVQEQYRHQNGVVPANLKLQFN